MGDTSPSGFCRSEPTEQVRHSPTCSRRASLTFNASSRAAGTCRFGAYQAAGHFVDHQMRAGDVTR
jgi:hypothetical protein